MKCTECGSKNFEKNGDDYVCSYCGAVIKKDTPQQVIIQQNVPKKVNAKEKRNLAISVLGCGIFALVVAIYFKAQNIVIPEAIIGACVVSVVLFVTSIFCFISAYKLKIKQSKDDKNKEKSNN